MRRSTSTSTSLSFIAFAVAVAFGVISVFGYERGASDWGLLSAFRVFLISLTVGSVAAVLFSVGAFIRREPRAAVSLWVSIPGLCFALLAGFTYASHIHDRDRKAKQAELVQSYREKLLSTPGVLRDEEWPEDDSPRSKALRGVLWKSEGHFSEEDFLSLAARHPGWMESMFYHSDCPSRLLGDGFLRYKGRSDRLPLSAWFREILIHPNSPIAFAEEVSAWPGLSENDRWTVDRILKAKSKKHETEDAGASDGDKRTN